ncbi:MFS transporter, partial [Streptomyces sp. NPDC014983]
MSVVDGVSEGAVSGGPGGPGGAGGAGGAGVPQRLTSRMRLTLVVLLVAQFMLAVDFSILNVAL